MKKPGSETAKRLKTTLKTALAVFVGAAALCLLTSLASKYLFGIELPEQESVANIRAAVTALVKRLCGGAGWRWALLRDFSALAFILVQITVVVPAAEEAIFRWLLWKLPDPKRPLVPAITSSALFAASHYIFMPWPDSAFLALFFFGMMQCRLYAATGRLWCPILLHSLFNTANLLLIFIFPS